MRQRFLVNATTFLLVASFLLTGCVTESSSDETSAGTHLSYFKSKDIYEKFFEDEEVSPLSQKVRGMILPHHLVVGKEVAKAYLLAQKTQPSVVVLIGPNHFGKGAHSLLTTDGDFSTPYGILNLYREGVQELRKDQRVLIDPTPFLGEHSISTHTAFIKKIFPKAQLLPIILMQDTKPSEAKSLGEFLATILPKDALIIASVDFSHYQPVSVSDFHDAIAHQTLRNFDFDHLPKLETDSNASLMTLLTYLTQKNAQKVLFESQTNSATYEGGNGEDVIETTSHTFLLFGDGKPEYRKSISGLFFGDAIFARGVEETMEKNGVAATMAGLAGKESRFLISPHVVALNLEGAVTDKNVVTGKSITIRHERSLLQKFLRAFWQFSYFSIANNHAFDAGEAGIADTIQFLSTQQKKAFGYPSPCLNEEFLSGVIALCSFDDSSLNIDLESALQTIRTSSQSADWTAVSVHWGKEGHSEANTRQREMAKKFVDAGASAVIGHHPHVVQDMEIYSGVPIFYSLGNFLFDESNEFRSTGMSVGFIFDEKQTTVYLYPLHTTKAQPRIFNPQERREFLSSYLKDWRLYIDPQVIGKLNIPRH